MPSHNSSAQTLDRYVDQLYFGMLSFNPDSSITDFLKVYVPVVFQKFDPEVKWTMYPPGAIEEPSYVQVINSYVFKHHPYFNGPFQSGQLAFIQKFYSDEKWGIQLTDVRLWFEFDNEKDASASFKQLVDTFTTFKTVKRVTSQQGMDKVEFADQNSDRYYRNIQIILVSDYALGKTYMNPTENGPEFITKTGYKILVEVGNQL